MRTVYAQSSDIRSRTWTQYRLDMKKKAIAELEFLPFLQRLLAARHNDSSVRVRKHGGDALLWFAPKVAYLATLTIKHRGATANPACTNSSLRKQRKSCGSLISRNPKWAKSPPAGRASHIPTVNSFISSKIRNDMFLYRRNGLQKMEPLGLLQRGAAGQHIVFSGIFSCRYLQMATWIWQRR